MESINYMRKETGKAIIQGLKNSSSPSEKLIKPNRLTANLKGSEKRQWKWADILACARLDRFSQTPRINTLRWFWHFVCLAAFGCCSSFAQNVTLVWQASPSPNIAGYVVFYGTMSGTYTYSNSVGLAANETFTNLQPGTTYYFAVSDFNTSGMQSALSSEVSYTVSDNAVITWSTPSNIVYGTPLNANQLNATANVPGSFAYNPPLGTVLPAGSAQTIMAIFTPQNTTNYNSVTNSVVINILPTPLTITGNKAGKIYGGPLPTLTATYAGFVNGDTVSSLATPPSLTTTASASSPVGSYPINAGGAVDPNYAISYVNGALAVSPATLKITAKNQSKGYGAALPTLTAAYSGFVNGDSVGSLTTPPNLSTAATVGTPVGTYPVTAGGAVDPNYAISYVNGALAVSPATLTVTANNQTKAYGAALPNFTATYSGFVNSDTVASLTTPPNLTTTATIVSPVGTYPITAGGAVDPNYAISYVNGTLTVTEGTQLVTWSNPASIVYGSALSSNQLNATASVPGSFAYSPTNGTVLNTGTNTLSVTFNPTDTVDYSNAVLSVNLVVSPASLIVSATNASRAYGQTNPMFGSVISGLQNGDNISATYGCAASASSSVGTYAIMPSLVDPENRLTNYIVNLDDGTLSVTPAPLKITANNQSKAYGATLPTLTSAYSGFVNGDTVAGLTAAPSLTTTASSSSPVGTYSINAGGATDPNYAISYVNGTLAVSPATLIITAMNQGKAYGAALPTFTATYSGFANGDTTASLTTAPSLSTTATTSSPVGTYSVAVGGAVDPNYSISYVNGALTVSPAMLTITANNQIKAYGAVLPNFTANYSGFVNGDTVASLTTAPGLTTAATASSSVGTYAITAGGAIDPNYSISYASGTLTITEGAQLVTWSNPASIVYGVALSSNELNATASVPGSFVFSPTNGTVLNVGTNTLSVTFTPTDTVDYSNAVLTVNLVVSPATLNVSAASASRVYGQTNPVFGGVISGLQNGDVITAAYECTGSTASSVGSYLITPSLVDPENRLTNYIVDLNNGILSVTQAPLTITANNQSKAYGATLPTLTATYSGFVNGNTAASLTTLPSLSTTATANSPVGTYQITAGGAADSNYAISYVNGALAVSPATLTITAKNQSKAYGAALPTLTAAYSGFVNGDTVANLTTPPSLSTAATAGSPVGTYSITANGAVDLNYAISYVNGTLTVTEGVQLMTWNNPASIVYGTALSSNELNATASVAGSFVYSPTNGTVLNAGTNTLSVTFTPTDTLDYSNTVLTVGLVVSPATLNVGASSASRAYGQTNPVFGGAISGLQNGDNITATYGCAATGSSSVGAYAIVPSLVDPENRLTNYIVNLDDGILSVTQADPDLVWTDPPPITYGTALSSNQLNATTDQPSYNPSKMKIRRLDFGLGKSVPGSFVYNPTNGTVLNAGTNTLSVTFTPTDTVDYSNAVLTVDLVVLPAMLTVSAPNAIRTYGQANPVFAGTISGLQNGDDITATYSCTGAGGSSVGTYPIVPTLVDPDNRLSNYVVTLNNGTLSIQQETPQIVWTNSPPISYGTALSFIQLNATVDEPNENSNKLKVRRRDYVIGNGIPGTLAYDPTNGAILDTGTNTLSVTFTPTDEVDYSTVTATMSLLVLPAPLTVTAFDANRSYGQTNPVFGGTIVGLQNGDNISATYNCVASANSPLGMYAIAPSLVDPEYRQTNYIVDLVNGTLSITQPAAPPLIALTTATEIRLQFSTVPSTTYGLQASSDLKIWNNISTFTDESTNGIFQYVESITNNVPARFYRLVSQ
jgi:hypothetical protein